jgi:3-oxoacyl-[acyl-carrier-protein] synthase-3
MTFIRTELTGFSKFLPTRRVTNDEMSQWMETSNEWILERTGIQERRFVDSHTASSDLAVNAVKSLLEEKNLQPIDFDYIIACTLSPDYYFPGIAPIVQHKLNFPNIPALDIRVQCSAFVYAVNLADALIKSGQYKRILLVFSDVQSKFLDFSTRGRNMAVLFADGAAAVVCEAIKTEYDATPTAHNKISGIIDTILGADGSGVEFLGLRSPGSAGDAFLHETDHENGHCFPHMDGKYVFKHAVTRMCEVAEQLIQKHNLTTDDIACLIPHQANLRISELVRTKINLPSEKVFNNIQNYGNTTSATIPICIREAMELKKIKKGDLIITVAFGAGFTWGGSLIRL